MNSNIIISGNIISELSEKIPSNVIALNELIKNSYDAGAKKVIIRLDSVQKKFIISDDGYGMDKDEIDTLFHISNSKKRYGIVNEYGRYTQGSKGLGFLSVFKFGKYVTWKTRKTRGLTFAVSYDDLIKSDDVSNYNIEIIEDDCIDQGTQIEIDITDYNLQSLEEYFREEKNYEKVINAFLDKDFTIELEIDGENHSNENILLLTDYLPERQLYYIKYNSDNEEIQYYYNNFLILNHHYKFNSMKYKLEVELQIFKLNKGDKSKISKLFYNHQDDLTPLIYINCNLFNNYNIFDPNIMKNIKSGLSLNQMIGYIKIISSDNRISFNSDRTQFLQNELTDDIIRFLKDINETIQRNGSKYRKHLVDLDFLKVNKISRSIINLDEKVLKGMIKDTFLFKDKVDITVEENRVVYSIFGKKVTISIEEDENNQESINKNSSKKETDSKKNGDIDNDKKQVDNEKNDDKNQNNGKINTKKEDIVPAVINLKNRYIRISIPSNQINLFDYVKSATDSRGNKIEDYNINIKVDNSILKSNILQSVNMPCLKIIEYSYLDSSTGLVIETLKIEFYRPQSKLNFKEEEGLLISLPANKRYTISFNYPLGKLINQINQLKLSEYNEVIACSLRAIFEISVDSIKKSGKFIDIFKDIKKLEEKVGKVVAYIECNNKYKSEIANATDIDYDSLKNFLKPVDFKMAIEKANLGAHKSTTYISEVDIKHLAKMASLFVIVVNEMINNEKII